MPRDTSLDRQVLFHEKAIPLPRPLPQPQHSSAAGRLAADAASGKGSTGLHDTPIVLVTDLEQHRDNPALHKHHKLARSLLSAGFAKELKPDAEERRRLETLVAYPPTTKLRVEEKTLMWKFRYSLTKDKRALTKLLKCVDWDDYREVQQAEKLVKEVRLQPSEQHAHFHQARPRKLQLTACACEPCARLVTIWRTLQWAPVDVQDLLELLGRAFVGDQYGWLREFAVSGLRDRATDTELLSYLLSLVQAIQYERVLQQPPAACPLASFLIQRAVANAKLANFLHWCARLGMRDELVGLCRHHGIIDSSRTTHIVLLSRQVFAG